MCVCVSEKEVENACVLVFGAHIRKQYDILTAVCLCAYASASASMHVNINACM